MKILSFAITVFLSSFLLPYAGAQKGMEAYLPEMEYDQSIPTPYDILGYNIGEWHISHDQLVTYMKALAEASDRIEMVEYARSHENRPLYLMYISSPENLARKEEIRKAHVQLTNPNTSDQVDISNLPSILLQGYSIHGNESSGSSAGVLAAYYLAAGQGQEVLDKLNGTFILLDPCYNPDGLNRFASWANTHKSKNLVSDPISRELNEVWPRGRTNHYWFDLNRDWLLLTHPESQGRIDMFHHWKPNVLTDHHEMGTNNTFFFQPGIPSRTNPNTPQLNQDLTEKIGTYHAATLDSIGSLYYTKASYDDYYYGKGSTYPDGNGAIGILFEQASSRGHLQESANGLLSFEFTIRNQFVTSLSSQKATLEMREELLNYKRDFYKKQQRAAKASKIKGYVFQDEDKSKMARFHHILRSHKVEIYDLKQDITANGNRYQKENSCYVPVNQDQYLMVKTIFEKVRTFPDSLFYDVSTWTMPLAFDIEYDAVTSNVNMGQQVMSLPLKGNLVKGDNSYAYILDWNDYTSPAALYNLQKQGLLTKVINKPFGVMTASGKVDFQRGDVMIPIQNQNVSRDELESILAETVDEFPVSIFAITTGWADNNMTLGNPSVSRLDQPNVALIVGEGVNSYDAGEVWHQLDTRLGIPLSMIDKRQLYRANFPRYNTIIMVHGRYDDLSGNDVEELKEWIAEGGNLILFRSAISWGIKQGLVKLETVKSDSPKENKNKPYQSSSAAKGARVLGGAIFNGRMDLSHPLCYGYPDENISLFRRGTTFYEVPDNVYATPVSYSSTPVASGYIPRGTEKKAANRPAITVHREGRGTVLCFQDNLLFRGYWYGGNKIFANALFFTQAINNGSKARD